LKVGGVKYVNVDMHSCNCVQNCGLCLKLDIMHNAFSSNIYKTIQNKIIFNVKMYNECSKMSVYCTVVC
jgi:hypothetical protein